MGFFRRRAFAAARQWERETAVMEYDAIYPSLKDRAVLVTGGGAGIGAAIVEHFCRQDARVAFVDIDETASRALVARIAAAGAPAPLFLPCDLRDIPALQAAIARAAETLGPIRVLVNNAAHDERHAIDEVTPEYWDDRMAVNLRHQFFAVQAVHKGMAEAGGGAIVNLGSVTWLVGQGGMPGYSAAKSAVAGLTRSLARDLGPDNIRVNSVLPGWIMTERQVAKWLTPESEAELLKNQCLKRKLYPDDVARAVLFFAADDSGACTSQSYIVDGGWV
jgi:NAD(P)-dependent dehydrogenase (short-subunit alcohol dehydrogenase family)